MFLPFWILWKNLFSELRIRRYIISLRTLKVHRVQNNTGLTFHGENLFQFVFIFHWSAIEVLVVFEDVREFSHICNIIKLLKQTIYTVLQVVVTLHWSLCFYLIFHLLNRASCFHLWWVVLFIQRVVYSANSFFKRHSTYVKSFRWHKHMGCVDMYEFRCLSNSLAHAATIHLLFHDSKSQT